MLIAEIPPLKERELERVDLRDKESIMAALALNGAFQQKSHRSYYCRKPNKIRVYEKLIPILSPHLE